jgi:ADP-ribosylglycohydrolase
MLPSPARLDKLTGVLLGCAVGDALGLPREGLSRRRAARIYGDGPLRHRFFFGRGLLSDDTEHACMTAQALLASPYDDAAFARSLAWRLRGWFAALPAAVGWGTLRAIVRLWCGVPPARSGVASAGNGAAMRAPILGVCLAHDPDRLESAVRASTRMTHRDPRAEEGALAIALAAAYAATRSPEEIDAVAAIAGIQARVRCEELNRRLDLVASALERGASAADFAATIGCGEGVSGFILDTVPAALFAWLSSPADARRAIETVIRMGGDADSTGAITGGLAGATTGASGLPAAWIDGITDWPRSIGWIRRLAARLAAQFPGDSSASITKTPGPLGLFWPAIPARNLLFFAVALAHGFRRMLPPY